MKYWICLLACIIGCSAVDEEQSVTTFPKNECVTAGAAYHDSFSEISGNCGYIPDTVIVVPENGQIVLEAACDGIPRYEGCSVFMDRTCVLEDGSELTETGKMDWAEDGSHGQGTVTIFFETVSGAYCVSTYHITSVRL